MNENTVNRNTVNKNTVNKNTTTEKGTESTTQKSSKKRITSKQVVALVGVVLLVLLYLITLVVAIVDTSASGKLFALCLFASIGIPFLIWIYVWMYGKLTNKKTFADFNIDKSEEID